MINIPYDNILVWSNKLCCSGTQLISDVHLSVRFWRASCFPFPGNHFLFHLGPDEVDTNGQTIYVFLPLNTLNNIPRIVVFIVWKVSYREVWIRLAMKPMSIKHDGLSSHMIHHVCSFFFKYQLMESGLHKVHFEGINNCNSEQVNNI